jgi:hypothetical protein
LKRAGSSAGGGRGPDGGCLWDADAVDPWPTLRWPTVRVLRYRQHKRTGELIEPYWLTDFAPQRVSSRTLYRMAKSRWEIENQGFHHGKTRHGREHVSHHHPNSLLIGWLVAILALTIERLYRFRYLRRAASAARGDRVRPLAPPQPGLMASGEAGLTPGPAPCADPHHSPGRGTAQVSAPALRR